MKDESISVMRMGIEALVGTVLLFLIFIATYLGKGWFLKEQENEVIKAQFKINAEIYHLISGEDISGDDIIEFILKHDMRYDYYIIINSHIYTITKDYAQRLELEGKDGDLIWSYDYLYDSIFGNYVYSTYMVTTDGMNGEIDSFTFQLK